MQCHPLAVTNRAGELCQSNNPASFPCLMLQVKVLDRLILYFIYNQAGRYCDNRNNGIDEHKGSSLCSEVHVTAALLCLWFFVFIRCSVVLGMLLMHLRAKACSCEFNERGVFRTDN